MRGVKALERAGYEVILDPDILEMRKFTRKQDERRAANFMGMWLDPRVKAVIGGTGGYGAIANDSVSRAGDFSKESENLCRILRHHRAASVAHAPVRVLRVFHGPTVDDLIPIARDPTYRTRSSPR